MTRSRKCMAFLAVALLALAAGCSFAVSRFDQVTWQSLQDIKRTAPEAYDSFSKTKFDTALPKALRTEVLGALARERAKDEPNKDTARQFEILLEMLDSHIQDRIDTGRWPETHRKNMLGMFIEAVDVLIATEEIKNK